MRNYGFIVGDEVRGIKAGSDVGGIIKSIINGIAVIESRYGRRSGFFRTVDLKHVEKVILPSAKKHGKPKHMQ